MVTYGISLDTVIGEGDPLFRFRGTRMLVICSVIPLVVGLVVFFVMYESKSTRDYHTNSHEKNMRIGFAYDTASRQDRSFSILIGAALDRFARETRAEKKVLEAARGETYEDKYARLKLLCQGGYNPVIVAGAGYVGIDSVGGPLARVARECPTTHFGVFDDARVTGDNISNLMFADEQGSFLVGAAASLKSKTRTVGFIGGCDISAVRIFESGYKAGVMTVDPHIKFLTRYLSVPSQECSGFRDEAGGEIAARELFAAGADIIYQVTGESDIGIFKAAKFYGRFVIGVNIDQYAGPGVENRDVIMTSMVRRVDVAISDFLKREYDGVSRSGPITFDLRVDGVGYVTSGGMIDDIKFRLDDYKQGIIDGSIVVPVGSRN